LEDLNQDKRDDYFKPIFDEVFKSGINIEQFAESIKKSVKFLEKSFKLACKVTKTDKGKECKLDLAKALLDAKDTDGYSILDYQVNE
jgi:hypothetical protein